MTQSPSLYSPLLLLLCNLTNAAAFGFSVEPQTTECFEERVKVSDHVLGQWGLVLLLGSENPDGDAAPDITGFTVKVTSPQGDNAYHVEDEPSGLFDFTASVEGEYFICFTNGRTNREDVTLKITVNEPPDLIKLAKTEHLSPIEERIKNVRLRDIRIHATTAHLSHLAPTNPSCTRALAHRSPTQLHEAMNMVRDVQDDIREHDAAQLKMTHSTRTWLLYFTLIEAAVLVGVTVWQNLCAARPSRAPHCARARPARLVTAPWADQRIASPLRPADLKSFFEVKRVI